MVIDDDLWSAAVKLLTEIETQSKRFESVTNGLMLAPESPINDSFWRVVNASLSTCSWMIKDTFGSLDWYVYECNFGASPKEAGRANDKRLIDSHEKLRWLIELD